MSSRPSPMLLHTESTVRALSAMVPTPEDFEDFVRNSKSQDVDKIQRHHG